MALPRWTALAPVLLFALTGMLVLLVDTFFPDTRRRSVLSGLSTLGSLAAVAVSGWFILSGPGTAFPPAPDSGATEGGPILLFQGQLTVDAMALLFFVVVGSVAALVSIASYDYLEEHSYQGAYYSLVMLAATGMALMATANSLAVAFIALELSSLPSYALVAYLKQNRGSVEAGLKYFLVGALSSAVLVYGISLVYGTTGALGFDAVAAALSGVDDAGLNGALGVGVLMVLGGFAFKTASVPFHFWAPEAYEGSPAPISAFLSSASKAAGFALAIRVFVTAFPPEVMLETLGIDWVFAFQVLAIVTMTVGNFAAATQEEVKRMLAYSSVGHAGYVLIGLAALAPTASGANTDVVLGASMMHLVVYGFMNTGAFLFVAMVEYWGLGRTFEDYNGLATRAPVACLAMTVCLFSLAGLPIGGGFMSKFVLFFGAVNAGFWWLAAVGAINSALSLYYYARVVKAMWIEDPADDLEITRQPLGLYAAVVAAALLTVLALPAFGFVSEVAVDAAASLLPGA
ncbi:oxidoreductase [Halobacteriales archaeon QS_8_69_26]|nr:MAG: oxidoreductase [Halobacteriales archaeon QS_8_69_26]